MDNSVAHVCDILLADESKEVVQNMGKRTVVIVNVRSLLLFIGKVLLRRFEHGPCFDIRHSRGGDMRRTIKCWGIYGHLEGR